MIPFQYVRSTNVKGATDAIKKDHTSKFIAGGSNLVDLMKRGVETPQKLIDINDLSLKNIEERKDGLYIGALALNSTVAEHDLVVKHFPLLSLALKAGATQQIRNMATVGGNMLQRTRCSYFYDIEMPCNKRVPGSGCGALKGYNRMHAVFGASENCIAVHPSDMCVALAALNATVLVQSSKGERKILFTDFHRLPGGEPQKDNNLQSDELITGVIIPFNNLQKYVVYLKVRDRTSYAFALVSVAVALDISDNVIKDARLAMGGVAHKPWRLFEAEQSLKGMPVNEESFNKVATIAMKGATGYGKNNFKLKMAPQTIVAALKQATGKV